MNKRSLQRILLATTLACCIDLNSLSAQERGRAGYSGISGYQVPLWLGVDLGLFKKYGLNLEPILFRGGAESTHALTGGEIQFDVVAPQPHIAANLSGADTIIIGTYFNKHTYSLVARAGIRSPQDLRGKKVGVLSVVGLNQIVVAAALRHWGMDEKSVTLVRAGGSRDRLTALQSGLIDATVLTGAFVDRAKAAGLSVLLDLGDLEDSFPTVSMMTTKSFQSSKRNSVRSFLQGLGEGIYIFKNDPAQGQKSLSKWMRTQDKSLLESAYKSYAPRISFPPYSELSGIQVVVDDLANSRADAKGKKAQEFVNEEVLREVDKQGFFKSLQKK
ncbi:MAG TPA: ABC transporter substrate-binding protein [Candidatus Binatia bacterium]|nr:ABC transporter substrate-binding protein [Candidatus Binatia bacterium]